MDNAQPAGNYYDKYGTKNPIARALMAGFLNSFDGLLAQCGEAKTALEVGCGEGELSIRVAKRGIRVSGFDISPEIVDEARRRSAAAGVSLSLRSDSIFNLRRDRDRADLIVCCEVMEHVDDPESAVDRLYEVCGHRLITSVPREPIWRMMNLMRGKYIRNLGNTPGHVQHWTTRGFMKLIGRRFKVIEVRTPLPWTMALCEPRT
ncbi:MAG: methyltransferase domain-containing protein [Mizugakiibacter sp.]|uniref:class I SAM-dependent methyltransferase n=1 Tax=Mizugakiibacter sp. TaxID=1972610 RepID=UPI0031BC9591|nr:methyltransferase domain-containing protein [Xanthomonadaceae bacterium]